MLRLRDSMKNEMEKINTQAAAGEDAKVPLSLHVPLLLIARQKSIEQRLQSTGQELAAVRAELQSEKAVHQTTAGQLAGANKEIVRSPLVAFVRDCPAESAQGADRAALAGYGGAA